MATGAGAFTHTDREGAVNKAMQQTMGRLAASVLAAVFLPAGGAGPLAATGPWMTSADRAAAYYGTAVATAGDVNGDGYDDVIVGAPGYNNGAGEEGAVFVYHGSAAGLSTTANWRAVANRANAAFGFSVATAGDVNGDGYDDVLVGAPGPETDEQGRGRVFVYHGSASGLSTAPSAGTGPNPKPDGQIVFAQAGAKFGTAVATAGDVNADGFADILIGAPKYDNNESNEGAVFVYHGSANGLSTTADWRAERNQAHAVFGTSVATAGDVNNDGYDDILVGSPGDSPGHSKAGAAFVYHGSASGLGTRPPVPSGPSPQPDWRVESNREGASLGWSVASAGDVNNDGFADVIVGAPWYGNGQAREGAAFVYHGSASGLSTARSAPGGPTPKPDWRVESDQEGASLGWSVATAGDVNADGYDEVIVGADYFDKGQADEGAAFVHHGSAAGLGPAAAWTGESDQEYSYFGRSVATAGDVNRDGYSELVIGAPWYDAAGNDESGAAFVYPGGAGGFEAAPDRTAFLRW